MKKLFLLLLTAVTLLASVSSCRTTEDAAQGKRTATSLANSKGKGSKTRQNSSKQEFRGAWIQTAFQDRYLNMTPQRCQEYLASLVSMLQETGFNAVIFQVRPEGDAFYPSALEPWSRFLTGTQGKAPSPQWDPMAYMIDLCHNHGMEFHAWINPYRSAASNNWKLSSSNIYFQHPEWFVTFDGKLYLNPGLPESRSWIRQVVKDIVTRYDVDAIHMDDYFYPYPVPGKTFDDGYAFQVYGPQMGLNTGNANDLGNFRRRSVNVLIQSVHDDIKQLKPWVRFGISPFGIYRNKSSWAEGSETNGTQCYDNLYADVLLWAQEGWIDYVIPQLYWEIGHSAADYKTLCDWWARAIDSRCHLYIGQSIERSLDKDQSGRTINDLAVSNSHFAKKLNQARSNRHIHGNCFWYAYQIEENNFHVRDFLHQLVFPTSALPPAYRNPSGKAPGKISGLEGSKARTPSGAPVVHLTWKAPTTDANAQLKTHHYNIYRFVDGERASASSLKNLYGHSVKAEFFDYNIGSAKKLTYIIVPVDHYNNEGKAVKRTFNVK